VAKPAFTAIAMEMVAGGLLLGIVGLMSGEAGRTHLNHVSGSSIFAFVYLIVFGSLVAYSAYIWLLHHVSVTAVSTYAYVNPLVAVVLGALVLGEPVTGLTAIAGLMIIAAVALILSSRPRPRRALAEPPEPLIEVA
jgi:drug/metabolite transporter (DMT)-like permease